jgi:hypothetical protein
MSEKYEVSRDEWQVPRTHLFILFLRKSYARFNDID